MMLYYSCSHLYLCKRQKPFVVLRTYSKTKTLFYCGLLTPCTVINRYLLGRGAVGENTVWKGLQFQH
jgi:hypothetical protein